MDGDDDLKAAIEDGAALALVRVKGAAEDRAGTRSRTAAYDVEVEARLTGALPSPVTLKHFGAPWLEVGRRYAVAAVDNQRHHDAWTLRFAAPADEPELEAALTAFRRRAG